MSGLKNMVGKGKRVQKSRGTAEGSVLKAGNVRRELKGRRDREEIRRVSGWKQGRGNCTETS
jgi:hypothetical protein